MFQDNCDGSCIKIIDNVTSFYQIKLKQSFQPSLTLNSYNEP